MSSQALEQQMIQTEHSTEVRFASFISGGFSTMAVINPLRKGNWQNAPKCSALGTSWAK